MMRNQHATTGVAGVLTVMLISAAIAPAHAAALSADPQIDTKKSASPLPQTAAEGAPDTQTEAPQAPTVSSETSEDITVTARRRTESIQKVPASITAFGSETLRAINPTNIGGVLNLAPGVTFSGESSYRPSLSIRGVSGSNEDAAVAMYLDGVYIGHDLGQNISNLDPDSIQILRGPQGALYGKNTLGGAIIVNSRAPSFETHVSALAGYGNDNSYSLRASLSGTITPDKIAGYVFGYVGGNDGRYYNVFTGEKVGNRHDVGGQAALLFQLSDRAKVTIRGDYSSSRSQEANRKGIYSTSTFGPNEFVTGYNNRVALDYIGDVSVDNYGTVMTVVVETDPFTVTSTTAYRGFDVSSIRDFDGTAVKRAYASIFQNQHQVSQEFTLVSPGNRRFNWIAGAQLFRENFSELFHIDDFIGNTIKATPPGRAPVTYDYPVPNYITTSLGVYAQANYRLTDSLTLATGLRYSIDHRGNYTKTETQTLSNPTAIGFQYKYSGSATYRALTPEASLTYEFTPSVSLYGKYGRSYRPGGFNINAIFDPNGQNEFAKESANSYEVGLRTRFLDGRMTLNTTAFRIDWKDQQVSYINAIGAFTVSNVQSRSQGVEVVATATVLPRLQISLAGSYLDATFGNVVLPYRDPVTRASSFVNAKGTPLVFAPKWSASASATYTQPLAGDEKIVARFDASYKSSQYVQPLRADLAGPSLLRLNGRLEYDRGRYSAALWIKNALNRFSNYVSQSTATVDVVGITEPRTFGAEIGFKF